MTFVYPRQVIEVRGCWRQVSTWKDGRPREVQISSDDYQNVIHEGEKWRSHRLSYHLNVSAIPRTPASRKEGLVLHECDNKWCIRPSHLYIGTAKQNAIDNAERNEGWRRKRVEIQKALGFPPVSKEGRARMAAANSKRMLAHHAKVRDER